MNINYKYIYGDFKDSFYWVNNISWFKLMRKLFLIRFVGSDHSLIKLGFTTIFDFCEFKIWDLSRRVINRKRKKISSKYMNRGFYSVNKNDIVQLQLRFLLQLKINSIKKSVNNKLLKTVRLF